MKLYLDLLFFLNFSFDSILLFATSYILKRNISIKRILLGGIVGGLSIFILFFRMNSIMLFFIKIFISILMCLTSFSYKNLKYTLKNLIFLYMTSIFLGGALYLLNIKFSYKQKGLIFYHNPFSINWIVLIIITPIIIYIYIKQLKSLKSDYSNYYKVELVLKNKLKLKYIGFLDTGNKLKDPYLNRSIIIVDETKLKNLTIDNYLFVPINTVSGKSYIKCIPIKEIYINNKRVNKKVLLGISKKKINMDGIDCILNSKILEG